MQDGRNERRRARRSSGAIIILGLQTSGFDGAATEIISTGEQHQPSVKQAIANGYVSPIFRDGEWRLVFTRAGIEKIKERQRGRAP